MAVVKGDNFRTEISIKDLSSEALKKITEAAGQLQSGFSKAQAQIVTLNQGLELLGRAVNKVQQITAATVGNYADFETALVGVQKTTDLSGASLEAFGANIQMMSERIPIAANELLGITQAAGQLGVEGADDLTKFTETVAKIGVATDLTGEEAATAFTRILNATKEPISNIDTFASVVVRLGNNFAATESEITRMATELARSTSVFGLGSENVLALSTAMKALGIQAQLGGSVVGKAFLTIDQAIKGGGENLERLTELTGMTGEELSQTFEEDATRVFQAFTEGLGRLEEEVKGGSIPALEALGLTGDEVNKVLPVLATRADLVGEAIAAARDEVENTSALNEEARKAFATLSSEMQLTVNALKNLGVAIGKELAPLASAFLEWVRDMIKVLPDLGELVLELAESILNVSAALGTAATAFVLYTKVQRLAIAAGSLSAGLAAGWAAVTTAISGAAAAALKFSIAMAPVTAIVVGVTALVIVIDLVVRNLKLIPNLLAQGAEWFNRLGLSARQSFNFIKGNRDEVAKLKEEIEKSSEKSAKLRQEFVDTFDGGFVGKLINMISKSDDAAEKLGETAKKTGKELGKVFGPENRPQPAALTKDQLDALKKIKDENKSIAQQQELAALESFDRIIREKELNLENLDVLREQLKQQGKFSEELDEQLRQRAQLIELAAKADIEDEAARIAAEQAEERKKLAEEQLAIDERRKDLLAEIASETQAMQEAEMLAGLQGVDLIEKQRELSLEALDARREEIKAAGDMSKEISDQLDMQEKLINQAADAELVIEAEIAIDRKLDITEAIVGGHAFAVALGMTFGDVAGSQIHRAFEIGIDALSAIGGLIKSSISSVAALFDPDFWNGIGDTLEGIVEELPDQLIIAFNKLPAIFENFIAKLPEVTEKILEALPAMVQAVLDQLPQFINVIFDALERILDELPALFQRVIDKLPEILQTILDRLPDIIEKFFEALPQIVNSLIRALPGLIIQIVEALPEIVEEFVAGLAGAGAEIAVGFIDSFIVEGGAVKIGIAIAKSLAIELPIAIAKGLVRAVQRAWDAVANGIQIPVPGEITELGGQLEEGLKKAGDVVKRSTSELFQVQDAEIRGRAQEQSDRLANAIRSATNASVTRMKSLWDKLKDVVAEAWKFVSDLWDDLKGIVETAWKFVSDLWEALKGIVQTAWAFVQRIWDQLAGIVSQAWSFVLEILQKIPELVGRAWSAVITFFTETLPGAVSSAFSFLSDLFNKLASTITDAFSPVVNILKGALEGFRDFFNNTMKGVFDGLKNAFNSIKGVFSSLNDTLNKIAQPIRDLVSAMNNFIANIGGGGGGDLFGGLFADGGLVTSTPDNVVQLFADGGPVIPKGNKQNGILYAQTGALATGTDTVPAMLTPGEFVVNRDSARNNIGLLSMINANRFGQVSGGGGGDTTININMNVTSALTPDQVRREVIPTMERELKRKSQQGKFVMSSTGLRNNK